MRTNKLWSGIFQSSPPESLSVPISSCLAVRRLVALRCVAEGQHQLASLLPHLMLSTMSLDFENSL
eukprot:1628566-Amphidinium_carterae.1